MNFLQRIPITYGAALAALLLLGTMSCEKSSSSYDDKIYSDRKVLLLYSAGHNSLSGDNLDNINDLIYYSDLHTDDPEADAILIFSHSNEGTQTPYLIYPHKDLSGKFTIDTLITFPSKTISASATTLNTVLTFVRDNFPADEYGLIFSSHGTGYLPAGYYNKSSDYEYSGTSVAAVKTYGGKRSSLDPVPVPGIYETDPLVRSVGQDYYSENETYEINLEDFAEAIPMRLKYIAFDACLMGGIEVAYQLRDKTEWLIASPTEILAEGMDYTTMASYLMARPEDDLAGFCENYYNYYNALSGEYQSATISLTNCTRLEPLAEICSEIFSRHRDGLDAINHNDIQQYYRYSYHWFFDIEDIITHIGCSEEELETFHTALEDCVVYKAATEGFLSHTGGFDVTSYSGLSMMLPNYAGDYLKDYYKTALDWNSATLLVE